MIPLSQPLNNFWKSGDSLSVAVRAFATDRTKTARSSPASGTPKPVAGCLRAVIKARIPDITAWVDKYPVLVLSRKERRRNETMSDNSSRWKKGQSGNPKGRPPQGRLGLADLAQLMMEQSVLVEVRGEKVQATRLQKIVADLTERADKGDMSALRLLLGEVRRGEREEWRYERMAWDLYFRGQTKTPARKRKETPTERQQRLMRRDRDERFLKDFPELRETYEKKWERERAEAEGEIFEEDTNEDNGETEH
jgi:hypothetical protein